MLRALTNMWGMPAAVIGLAGCSLVFPSDGYSVGGVGAGSGTGAGVDAFETQCRQPDVARCMAFDDMAAIDDLHTLETCDQAFEGCHGDIDSDVRRSGDGALRMRLPAQVSSDFDVPSIGVNFSDGSVNEPPDGPYPTQFVPGDTFYVAWAMRLTAGMLADDLGTTGWYAMVVGDGDDPGDPADPISEFFIGVGASIGFAAVKVYGNLWRTDYCASFTDLATENMFSSEVFQNQTGCTSALPGRDRCVNLVPNTWMTFQLGVDVGDWGMDNTRIRLWVATGDEAPALIIDAPVRLCSADETVPIRFGKVWFNPGIQNRTDQPVDNFVWYDNLVISRAPVLSGT